MNKQEKEFVSERLVDMSTPSLKSDVVSYNDRVNRITNLLKRDKKVVDNIVMPSINNIEVPDSLIITYGAWMEAVKEEINDRS